VPKKKKLSN